MTDATAIPNRMTFFDGEVVLYQGEWRAKSSFKYQCGTCGGGCDHTYRHKNQYGFICSDCCGGSKKTGGTRNWPFRRRDGHQFSYWVKSGNVKTTYCRFCRLKKPETPA